MNESPTFFHVSEDEEMISFASVFLFKLNGGVLQVSFERKSDVSCNTVRVP